MFVVVVMRQVAPPDSPSSRIIALMLDLMLDMFSHLGFFVVVFVVYPVHGCEVPYV